MPLTASRAMLNLLLGHFFKHKNQSHDNTYHNPLVGKPTNILKHQVTCILSRINNQWENNKKILGKYNLKRETIIHTKILKNTRSSHQHGGRKSSKHGILLSIRLCVSLEMLGVISMDLQILNLQYNNKIIKKK